MSESRELTESEKTDLQNVGHYDELKSFLSRFYSEVFETKTYLDEGEVWKRYYICQSAAILSEELNIDIKRIKRIH